MKQLAGLFIEAGFLLVSQWSRFDGLIAGLTGLPAISVPCGFTKDGLPIGLQIVGRHQREFEVLQLAYAFEQATQYHQTRPAIAFDSFS